MDALGFMVGAALAADRAISEDGPSAPAVARSAALWAAAFAEALAHCDASTREVTLHAPDGRPVLRTSPAGLRILMAGETRWAALAAAVPPACEVVDGKGVEL